MKQEQETNFFEKDEKRNLKSWAVKLPEEVIEEIEKLHQASGLRFKNEFVEYLLKQYKVNLFKEGKQTEDLLHSEVLKNSESDVYELGKLTQMMQELFVHRLEKESLTQYELARLKKEHQALKEAHQALHDVAGDVRNTSYLESYVRKEIRQGFGHRLFVGVSGAGKTKAAMCEIKKAMEQKRQVIVVDLTGEYDAITTRFDGVSYAIYSDNGVRINPFEVSPSISLKIKMVENIQLIELLIRRQVSSRERKVLLDCLEKMYRSFGITEDNLSKIETMPTFTDLEKELQKIKEGVPLADELAPFTYGFLTYFNGERNFHVYESPITSFNLHENEREIREGSAYMTLSFIYQMMKEGVFKNTLLVIDQLWIFMQHPELRDLLTSVLREAKKYGVELLLITQTMKDVGDENTVLMNIATKVYFRQSVSDINYFIKQRLLPQGEAELLGTIQVGEALVDGKMKFMMTFDVLDEFDEKSRNILY